mgnify:CR=1 FL=1
MTTNCRSCSCRSSSSPQHEAGMLLMQVAAVVGCHFRGESGFFDLVKALGPVSCQCTLVLHLT